MLNSEDFEVIDGLAPYNFKMLTPIRKQSTYSLYQPLDQDLLVKVMTTKNLYMLQNIHHLEQLQLIQGPLGYLSKDTIFYIFIDDKHEKTLADVVKERSTKKNKPYLNEQQVYGFINLVLSALHMTMQKGLDQQILVLTPKNFVCIPKDNKYCIKFKFPIDQFVFQQKGIVDQYLKQNKEYCAPQLLKQLSENKRRKTKSKYGKSALYSLGLMLLFIVYSESFTDKHRLSALQNHLDMENEIKFKRKQIEVFYNNIIVSKMIKILLQRKQSKRDDIRTLRLKLLSIQFLPRDRLKQKAEPEVQNSDDGDQFLLEHKTTRSFDDGEKILPFVRQKTIQIQVMLRSGGTSRINNNSQNNNNYSSGIKDSKMTIAILPSIQDDACQSEQDQKQQSPQHIKGAQCFKSFQQVANNFPIDQPLQQFSFSLKKKLSVSSKDGFGSQAVESSMVSLNCPNKPHDLNSSFIGRVQENKKFKLISCLLLGIITILVGLCLLYLSLFSQN